MHAHTQAAQRFSHLQSQVAAATTAFEARRKSAEAALDAAVANSPMQVSVCVRVRVCVCMRVCMCV